MDAYNRKRLCNTSLCIVAMAVALLTCGFVSRQVESQVAPQPAVPVPSPSLPELQSQYLPHITMPTREDVTSFIDSMIHIENPESGGHKVKIHLPVVFDMTVEILPDNLGMRMEQSVMKRLVQVYIDRVKDPESNRIHGPVVVKMLGWPAYQNSEAKAQAAAASAASGSSTLSDSTASGIPTV